MTYRVKLTPTALADAENFYLWIREDSPINAASWFNGLLELVETLSSMPERCPVAPETTLVRQEIRCLLYKQRYRVLYGIEDKLVRIYHIRHTSQQWMTREEFVRTPHEVVDEGS
jgi:plasmid stabilization system protein ParE